MQETRRLRLQSVIQKELSILISREIKDPRVPPLTITSVELTNDAEQATVFISILSGSKDQVKDCLKGLSSAAGFMRRHLARILTVRHIPALSFREDRGFENTIRVHELLKEISQS